MTIRTDYVLGDTVDPDDKNEENVEILKVATCPKVVYSSGVDSGTITNPTAGVFFDTHQFTIPLNDLVNGVKYKFDLVISQTLVAGSVQYDVYLGSTNMGGMAGALNTQPVVIRGTISGTAAAGGSVNVKLHATLDSGTVHTQKYAATAVATNGNLLLKFDVDTDTSNAGNTFVMNSCDIIRVPAV